ncbi:MAG: helix-turn-helix transcriptional regulator [Verrucomicrobiaceae bacterium]|nr:helix-turn-helix transcriptional regulator [Verrucomicrobiaceae bacterium]
MQIRTPKEIGLLIRDQRKQLGWTQEVFAKRLGVSRLWVVQLEQGKATAQIGLVMRALNELDVPIQVDVLPKIGPRRAVDYRDSPPSMQIDLDSIIRETSVPYKFKS